MRPRNRGGIRRERGRTSTDTRTRKGRRRRSNNMRGRDCGGGGRGRRRRIESLIALRTGFATELVEVPSRICLRTEGLRIPVVRRGKTDGIDGETNRSRGSEGGAEEDEGENGEEGEEGEGDEEDEAEEEGEDEGVTLSEDGVSSCIRQGQASQELIDSIVEIDATVDIVDGVEMEFAFDGGAAASHARVDGRGSGRTEGGQTAKKTATETTTTIMMVRMK